MPGTWSARIADRYQCDISDEIADWFETLARAEKSHAGRFTQGLESIS